MKCPKEILIDSLDEAGQKNLDNFLKERRVKKREVKILVKKSSDGFRKTKRD